MQPSKEQELEVLKAQLQELLQKIRFADSYSAVDLSKQISVLVEEISQKEKRIKLKK